MDDKTGLERELKFHCPDLNTLRERLVGADAERVAPSSLEDNLIFDRGLELVESGRILRLRRDGSGARLTYKGPATYEGGVKVRKEQETRVADAEAVEQILTSLGYEVTGRYQKHREEWAVGGVLVALDHTPIGDFTEFEGDGAETLAARFGFPAEGAERRNYLELYADHRKDNPAAPEDMVFVR
ncbi:MAG: class IV adenylate cyclase [Acidobacteriota bacterium]|nr:class IV adenylate cyclase [Acidobacteriota bacterium]